MGQKIEITSSSVLGDVAVFDTDRSLGGQDGDRFRSVEEAGEATTLPADLAGRIFSSDAAVQSVYVTSNVVTVERGDGWDETAVEATGAVISEFFLFY